MRRFGSHVIGSRGVAPEDRWYEVLPFISGMPDHRPSNENAIRGLINAERDAARRNAALPDEERARTEYRPVEVAKPRLRREGQGPPKHDDRKTP